MMNTLYSLQSLAMMVLGLAAFGASVFSFIDAARHPKEAYAQQEKLSKPVWLGITGAAALITLTGITNVMAGGIFALIAVVAVGVYLADVRPALKQISPYIRKRKNSSGGHGPHGSW